MSLPQPERRARRRRRWWRAHVAVLLAATAGPVAGAAAQEPTDPYAAFGGLNAHARAGGVQVSYDVEDVLPLPPPLLEVTVPTSRATTTTGPTSLAFGSLAYPGDLIGNLPSLAEQSAPGSGALVPPYPLAVLAEHPSGPAEARQDLGTASAAVAAGLDGARAGTTLAAADVPGAVTVGAITTSTRTGLEDGRLVARAQATASSVSLLFGAIVLEDVAIDVVAGTDGAAGATDGSVTIGSASVLGTPARFGSDGLVLGDLPPTLGALLGGADDLHDLLVRVGVRLSAGHLVEAVDGAEARIDGAALLVQLDLDGRDGLLGPLLALLPSDRLPGQGLPGLPVNTSPQALVNLLKETHVVQVDLAPVTARVDASPGFSPAAPVETTPPATAGPVAIAPSAPPVAGGFTTPLPPATAPLARAATRRGVVPGRPVEALLGLLVALSLPLLGRGAAGLLDACLARPAAGCSAGGTPRPGGGG